MTKTGVELIAAERRRQIEVEGFDQEHDWQHGGEELALAAMYYAAPAEIQVGPFELFVGQENVGVPVMLGPVKLSPLDFFPRQWHIDWAARNSKTRRRQLVVAGALIAAEIDRLQNDTQERWAERKGKYNEVPA